MSIDEFSFLVGLVDDNAFLAKSTMQMWAKKLLRIYFRHPLQKQQADILAKASLTVQDVWLESVCGRKLTDIELEMLVERMPWHSFRRFPQWLPEEYLQILFATRNPRKIVAYCREFALPLKFEKMLIEKYRCSLQKNDAKMTIFKFGRKEVNGWREALEAYLSGVGDEKMTSCESQKMLLDLADDDLLYMLIERCSISSELLHQDVIWSLVEQHKTEALRLLLKVSSIPNIPALIIKLEQKIPELKYQYYIAEKRYRCRIKELENGVFIGAIAPKPKELDLLLKYDKYSADEKDEFAQIYLLPWLHTFSPSMCAFMAYYFPQYAEDIWKALKSKTENL